MFDIVMFVLFYRDPDGTHYLIVLISNVYVQIIGVLFATIWRATYESGMNIVEGSTLPKSQELSMSIEFAQNREIQISKAGTSMTADNIELSTRKEKGSDTEL